MLTTLHNERLTVTVSSKGAEMQSLDGKNGISYLWNGDPNYWSGRSPHLFPIVGGLRGGRASSAAGEVTLPKHGFIRKTEILPTSATDVEAIYRYSSNEQTLAQYPYAFTWEVCYVLCDDTVRVIYTVHNDGDVPMPYCVGGHPAFRVPLCEGERFEDTVLELETAETVLCPQVDLAAGLIDDGSYNRLLNEERQVALHHVLFNRDALIMENLKSTWLQLRSLKSGHGVRVTSDMPFWGVWSPLKDSPFVCIEPWTGMGTRYSEDDVLEHKLGMHSLAPHSSSSRYYAITVF